MPLVIKTQDLCTYLMHELVQMNLSYPKRCLRKHWKYHFSFSLSFLHFSWKCRTISLFLSLLFSIFFSDTHGPCEGNEIQPHIWCCDIWRCEGNHWVLESYYTWVPREWVCPHFNLFLMLMLCIYWHAKCAMFCFQIIFTYLSK